MWGRKAPSWELQSTKCGARAGRNDSFISQPTKDLEMTGPVMQSWSEDCSRRAPDSPVGGQVEGAPLRGSACIRAVLSAK